MRTVTPTEHEETLEAMARAAWDVRANVPWDTFMREHPECRAFYLEGMQAALDAYTSREAGRDWRSQ